MKVAVGLLGIVLVGCMPFASPPVHGRVGAGWGSTKYKPKSTVMPESEIQPTYNRAEIGVGLDSSAIVDAPFSVEGGIMTDFNKGAFYFEGGPMYRIRPKTRINATAGGEYWFGDDRGGGVRASFSLEYATRFVRGADKDYDPGSDGTHNASTTYMLRTGPFGVGGFVDVGYRWYEFEKNYAFVIIGLSFRLPAMVGAVDVTASH